MSTRPVDAFADDAENADQRRRQHHPSGAAHGCLYGFGASGVDGVWRL